MSMTSGFDVLVLTGPPDKAGRDSWGFYQFPNLWQGADGTLYLSVNVGVDSQAGHHEPSACFLSRDGGRRWISVGAEDMDLAPQVYALPDGEEIAFGGPRTLSHFKKGDGFVRARPTVSELGLTPVMGPFTDPYNVNEYCQYRLGDIPEPIRRFRARRRSPAHPEWQEQSCIITEEELLVGVLMRAGWWDEQGVFAWEVQDQELEPPEPHKHDVLEVLPDGTVLWALETQNPTVPDRRCGQISCLASSDHGRTWTLRGRIAHDTTRASHGYGFGEQALARLPNGELLCLMRTSCSTSLRDTTYLAAARSRDDGCTWSPVAELAPFSVTPHLIVLENGCTAAVYGRPGVHVRLSLDSGETWSDPTAIVGPSEACFKHADRESWWEGRHDYSCCNTTWVMTGPDRFLLAYSDFQHAREDGRICKAIRVREIVCAP